MEAFDAAVRRTWRRTAVIAVVGFVVGSVVGFLTSVSDPAVKALLTTVGSALALGGFAGMFSVAAFTLAAGDPLREIIAGVSAADRRMVKRAVRTLQPVTPADSDLARRAREYAQVAARYQPFTVAQMLLLYAGIFGGQLPDMFSPDSWFIRITCATAVIFAAGVTIKVAQVVRRAHEYVRTADIALAATHAPL